MKSQDCHWSPIRTTPWSLEEEAELRGQPGPKNPLLGSLRKHLAFEAMFEVVYWTSEATHMNG